MYEVYVLSIGTTDCVPFEIEIDFGLLVSLIEVLPEVPSVLRNQATVC